MDSILLIGQLTFYNKIHSTKSTILFFQLQIHHQIRFPTRSSFKINVCSTYFYAIQSKILKLYDFLSPRLILLMVASSCKKKF